MIGAISLLKVTAEEDWPGTVTGKAIDCHSPITANARKIRRRFIRVCNTQWPLSPREERLCSPNRLSPRLRDRVRSARRVLFRNQHTDHQCGDDNPGAHLP